MMLPHLMKMVQTSACDGRKTKWSNEMRQIKNLPGNVLGFREALRAVRGDAVVLDSRGADRFWGRRKYEKEH